MNTYGTMDPRTLCEGNSRLFSVGLATLESLLRRYVDPLGIQNTIKFDWDIGAIIRNDRLSHHDFEVLIHVDPL